ncbi:MAG: hypothetical protein K2K81_01825 [Muribaculaceae bacterium]|nr:hypothetical protein [Muribaculaceae bacterium]
MIDVNFMFLVSLSASPRKGRLTLLVLWQNVIVLSLAGRFVSLKECRCFPFAVAKL